ncbi:MAG: response regulator [Deltaproteobacteria bacterium]|nr:response regulator [Deltaproteobacteria bacterium]
MVAEPARLGLRIGEILRKAQLISDDQMASAVSVQKVRGGRLGEILVSLNCVTEDELLDVLARQMGILALRRVDLESLKVPDEVAAKISKFLVEEDLVFPLAVDFSARELGLPPDEWIVSGVLTPPPRGSAGDRRRPVLVSRTVLRGLVGHLGVAGVAPPYLTAVAHAHAEPNPLAAQTSRGARTPPVGTVSPVASAKSTSAPAPDASAPKPHRAIADAKASARGVAESSRAPSPPPTEKTGATARPIRRRVSVLLVEADAALRSALATLLGSDAHVIRSAGTVDEALAAIEAQPFDVLLGRSPNVLSELALTSAFRARNPFGEFMVLPPLAEKVFGERVDSESLFRFFFNCFDKTLRLLRGRQGDNRSEARDAAEIAREVAWECGLTPRGQDEVFLAVYLDGIDETLTSHGYPPGTVAGASPNSIVLHFLESAACPYDLRPLLARAPIAPTSADAPESVATKIVRAVIEYRHLMARGGGKVSPRQAVQTLERLSHDSRVTVAMLHAFDRRAVPDATDGRPSVLLVDTDPQVMSQIEERLASLDCAVQVVSDGNEALALCQRKRVALVIAETDLPGIDGFRLCAALRSDSSTKNVKFFFVTREADSAKIRRGLEVGADDYIIKPPNFDLLLVKATRVVAEVNEGASGK